MKPTITRKMENQLLNDPQPTPFGSLQTLSRQLVVPYDFEDVLKSTNEESQPKFDFRNYNNNFKKVPMVMKLQNKEEAYVKASNVLRTMNIPDIKVSIFKGQ